MMRNQVIVCFSTISWDYLWQRHQEFMSRFARAGNRVLFVEPIGIRMPKWEDRGRVLARLRNRTRTGRRGLRAVAENVWAVDPLVNPFQQVGYVHRRNVAALTGRLRTALAQVGGGATGRVDLCADTAGARGDGAAAPPIGDLRLCGCVQ